jgi:uncharacterized protein (DUF2344 family)
MSQKLLKGDEYNINEQIPYKKISKIKEFQNVEFIFLSDYEKKVEIKEEMEIVDNSFDYILSTPRTPPNNKKNIFKFLKKKNDLNVNKIIEKIEKATNKIENLYICENNSYHIISRKVIFRNHHDLDLYLNKIGDFISKWDYFLLKGLFFFI